MRYEIVGETLPAVICTLEEGETMITEKGAMSWMSPNMKMETSTNGGIGKAFGRMFSGESIFQNTYTAKGGHGMIAFASSFPGKIVAHEVAPGREIVVQKSGFWQQKLAWICRSSSRSGSVPEFSAERDLSCRSFPDAVWHFWNLTVMW